MIGFHKLRKPKSRVQMHGLPSAMDIVHQIMLKNYSLNKTTQKLKESKLKCLSWWRSNDTKVAFCPRNWSMFRLKAIKN
jgi:hypothetical protein